MYYGYNDNKQLIMADEAFIELLGYNTFNDLIEANIIDTLKFENSKVSIQQDHQKISSDFMHHEIYGTIGEFYLVELKNITVEKIVTKIKQQKESRKQFKTNYQEIYLDVEKISNEIGLTVDDYKLYLDSFIDQSIIDEKRLLEGNDKVIKNLSNLALTLKIPHINILLLKIQKLSHRERMPLIDQYYTKLALLTLERPENYEDDEFDTLLEEDKGEDKEELLNARFTDLLNTVSTEIKQDDEIDFDEFDLDELDEGSKPKESLLKPANTISESVTSTQRSQKEKSVNPISSDKEFTLDNVPALPISYNPQTAANELNLPVVLIEEFVEDFIEQAYQDKDHLLTSYYQEDMDNIHELGHKLKGAASNLRINELADILEEIQYCTEHAKLKELFIKYWGHFLSLEDYMKQLKTA
jgi:HPt (histidine-containing phosphotransfer) domain-containing protein